MKNTGDIRIDTIMPDLNPMWRTVDFEDALEKAPTIHKIKLTTLNEIGLLPVIDQGDNFITGYINNVDYAYTGELPVIIFGDHTRRFKLIDFSFCIGADGCKILKPKPFLDIKFFYNYLCSLNIVSNGYSRHYKFLKEIKVPVPELEEQRRIIVRLEASLSRLNSAANRLKKIPSILRRFRQSVLSAACSGRLTEDWRKGKDLLEWENQPIEKICSHIVDCPHSTPKWAPVGKLCVRTTNFKEGYLDLSEKQYVAEETYNNRISRLKPQSGDILYSREGGILGIACMIPHDIELCLGQRMMLMRVADTSNSKYIMNVLNSPLIIDIVKEKITGSASPHINVGDVKKFPIALPPLPEQEEIVRRVDKLFAIVDKIEERYNNVNRQLERAERAIYAKAFRGEF